MFSWAGSAWLCEECSVCTQGQSPSSVGRLAWIDLQWSRSVWGEWGSWYALKHDTVAFPISGCALAFVWLCSCFNRFAGTAAEALSGRSRVCRWTVRSSTSCPGSTVSCPRAPTCVSSWSSFDRTPPPSAQLPLALTCCFDSVFQASVDFTCRWCFHWTPLESQCVYLRRVHMSISALSDCASFSPRRPGLEERTEGGVGGLGVGEEGLRILFIWLASLASAAISCLFLFCFGFFCLYPVSNEQLWLNVAWTEFSKFSLRCCRLQNRRH